MKKLVSILVWSAIAALGAAAFGILALKRGENINAAWLLAETIWAIVEGYFSYGRVAPLGVRFDPTTADYVAYESWIPTLPPVRLAFGPMSTAPPRISGSLRVMSPRLRNTIRTISPKAPEVRTSARTT